MNALKEENREIHAQMLALKEENREMHALKEEIRQIQEMLQMKALINKPVN